MVNRDAAAVPSVQRGEHFPIGLRVRGRYRVVSELGAGAFGTVCIGEDESTGHRVAIRFFPRSFVEAPHAMQAVLRMARSVVAASNSHPGMVRVLEFGELEAGRPFTVSEFVEGHRLSEMLAAGGPPLEIAAAMRLALDLGAAVETLHNMGFIHGALRPRNVMVTDDGRVKLMDVDLAGLRDAREMQGLVTVEPLAEYLSPEQILKAPVSEKTDIYAFGCILYELLCGAPPFQASTREAVLAKHLKEGPVAIHKQRSAVPGSVERAVTLALYKQPEPRPLMGDILNLLWTGAHGPTPQRKRAAVIVSGGALAALAVVAVIWGALALRPSTPALVAPTVRESAPAAASPTTPVTDTRAVPALKPATPALVPPSTVERAPVSTPNPSVRAPEPAPVVRPTVPPPVERAPVTAPLPSVRAPEAAVRPTAPPAVSPLPERAPVTVPPTSAAPVPESRLVPAARPPLPPMPAAPVTPAPVVPAPSARAATPPSTSGPAVVQPRVESREQPRAPQAPGAAAPERPAPSVDADDPRAVIDWLLKPRQ